MKTGLLTSILIGISISISISSAGFAQSTGANAIQQKKVSAICSFNTVGWSKIYGKDSLEKTKLISGADRRDVWTKCKSMAKNYAEFHIGEGDISNIYISESYALVAAGVE